MLSDKERKEYKNRYQREYRAKNKDKFSKYRKKYKERVQEYQKEYCKKNKDKFSKYKKKYRQKNKEKLREYYHTPKGQEIYHRFMTSPKGKEYRLKYNRSEKRKSSLKKFFLSEKGIISRKKVQSSEKNRFYCRVYQSNYKKINKDKTNARNHVYRLIREGKIKKSSDLFCEMCKKRNAEQYHHYIGYEKINWEKVIPVCKKCHREHHTLEKEKSLQEGDKKNG